MQAEVDTHIQSLYGSTRPQQILFAESAGQLRLEAAAENGHGALQRERAGPAPGHSAGGLAARLAPANGIAQPSVAQQLVSRCACKLGNFPYLVYMFLDSAHTRSGTTCMCTLDPGQQTVLPEQLAWLLLLAPELVICSNGTTRRITPTAAASTANGPSTASRLGAEAGESCAPRQPPSAQGLPAAQTAPAGASATAAPSRSLAPAASTAVGFPAVQPVQMTSAQPAGAYSS